MKEISAWSAMSEAERLHCMKHVLPLRQRRAELEAKLETAVTSDDKGSE